MAFELSEPLGRPVVRMSRSRMPRSWPPSGHLGAAAIFAEPAAAAGYAGLEVAARRGLVAPGEKVVLLSTGSGLKDIRAAMQAAGEARVIEPTLAALQAALA